MKILFILRHAKSSWKDPSLNDHDRPLNKRGQKDAQSMGKLMRKLEITPDLILSSSAVRACETAQLVKEKAGHSIEIESRDDLYAFEPAPFLNALIHLDDRIDSVMLVGHNPAMEELVAGLTGEVHTLPTAALAQIQLPIVQWEKVTFGMQARLKGIWRPKEIQAE